MIGPAAFRSLRIDSLLGAKPSHSVDDFKRYQSDVKVVQHAMLMPLIAHVGALSDEASALKAELLAWDGRATLDSRGALALYELLRVLKELTWDEKVFEEMLQPTDMILLDLLNEDDAIWLDVQSTSNVGKRRISAKAGFGGNSTRHACPLWHGSCRMAMGRASPIMDPAHDANTGFERFVAPSNTLSWF